MDKRLARELRRTEKPGEVPGSSVVKSCSCWTDGDTGEFYTSLGQKYPRISCRFNSCRGGLLPSGAIALEANGVVHAHFAADSADFGGFADEQFDFPLELDRAQYL